MKYRFSYPDSVPEIISACASDLYKKGNHSKLSIYKRIKGSYFSLSPKKCRIYHYPYKIVNIEHRNICGKSHENKKHEPWDESRVQYE
jgi:hypothetical protein